MAKSKPVGESEFGGGGGLIQSRNISRNHLSGVEEVWAIYATDPGSTADPDPKRVGVEGSYDRIDSGPSGVPPVAPISGV